MQWLPHTENPYVMVFPHMESVCNGIPRKNMFIMSSPPPKGNPNVHDFHPNVHDFQYIESPHALVNPYKESIYVCPP